MRGRINQHSAFWTRWPIVIYSFAELIYAPSLVESLDQNRSMQQVKSEFMADFIMLLLPRIRTEHHHPLCSAIQQCPNNIYLKVQHHNQRDNAMPGRRIVYRYDYYYY